MDKEFEISFIITTPNHETEDTIVNKFIEWIQENSWLCVGTVREYNEDDEDGWEYSEN